MTIEVTDKDLDNLTAFIKMFGISYFKETSGQQQLAHVRLMEAMVDLANRVLKAKEEAKKPVPVRVDNKSSVDIKSIDAPKQNEKKKK